jgi:hypothetical protein
LSLIPFSVISVVTLTGFVEPLRSFGGFCVIFGVLFVLVLITSKRRWKVSRFVGILGIIAIIKFERFEGEVCYRRDRYRFTIRVEFGRKLVHEGSKCDKEGSDEGM